MDNSDDMSFFDDPEFNFAKGGDEEPQHITAVNVIKLHIFSTKVLSDNEVAGFAMVKIKNRIKEGSFFLRIETIEELCLEKINKEFDKD